VQGRHLDCHPAGELPIRQDLVHDAAATLARRHEHMLQAREACARQTPTGCFLHTTFSTLSSSTPKITS
jgi:hypothetical protein